MKLSFPSKMPCASVGLPAIIACKTGAKLAKVAGSVCAGCYAMKGNYRFSNVKMPREANLLEVRHALKSKFGRQEWVNHMASEIKNTEMLNFRWHDSGDIISEGHLEMILDVCVLTPDVSHWLPTREYDMVKTVAEKREIPANMNIRLSAHMIGKTLDAKGKFTTSSVESGSGWVCPATSDPSFEGKCNHCRACWNREVPNVDYAKH